MSTTPTKVNTTAIGTPTNDVGNHTLVLRQLKETTEVAQRLRGDPRHSFVRLGELVDAGVARLVGETLQLPNANAPLVLAGQTVAPSATAGTASVLPGPPIGYLVIEVNGGLVKLALYAN